MSKGDERLKQIEESLKAFVHWKTVAGDTSDIDESPAPDIAYLLERLKSAEEALRFYEEVVPEFYDDGLDDNGLKARAHFEKWGNK